MVELVLFLLGATLITNMHPLWMQRAVIVVGCILLITIAIWIGICKRGKKERSFENGAEGEIRTRELLQDFLMSFFDSQNKPS